MTESRRRTARDTYNTHIILYRRRLIEFHRLDDTRSRHPTRTKCKYGLCAPVPPRIESNVLLNYNNVLCTRTRRDGGVVVRVFTRRVYTATEHITI